MRYNQKEALLRFEGLSKLWESLHERSKEPIETMARFEELSAEGRHLVDSYNEEVQNYGILCERENATDRIIDLIQEIQAAAICTGRHLMHAKEKLDDVLRGKIAFTEMLGQAPPKNKVWN